MFMLPSMANANRGPGCACQVITMAEPNPSFLETIVIGNGAPQIQPALASFIGALSPEDLQVFVENIRTALSYSQFWGNELLDFSVISRGGGSKSSSAFKQCFATQDTLEAGKLPAL
jgi:hypothetical protein